MHVYWDSDSPESPWQKHRDCSKPTTLHDIGAFGWRYWFCSQCGFVMKILRDPETEGKTTGDGLDIHEPR